ncbi:helix-turn-helix domain-containing protein [Bacillus gobiensis]|uniref:helix-turn-helix domain-containing protein n=1 Tax=Bacillus gobiensis TaxID=1441095 RepID=UPI003D1E02D6
MLIERLNLMDMQQAMNYLGVSRATIDRWRKDKDLPFFKIGKEVLFNKNELEEWIYAHSIKKQNEVTTVTIGYQSGTAHMWTALLMKELKYFEEELYVHFPSQRVLIKWCNAASGLELVELMIKGEVQIASLGDYPMTICNELSKLLPNFNSVILGFDGKTRNGSGISFVTPKDKKNNLEVLLQSPISTVSNSSAYIRLQSFLSTLGEEVHPKVVYKPMNESMESIVQQQIGCSVMWEPYPSLISYYGTGEIFVDEAKGGDYLTGIVSEESWIRNHEGVTISYLKAHLRTHQLIRNNPEKAAQILSVCTNIPFDVVFQIISKVRWDSTIYNRDLETLNKISSNTMKYVNDSNPFLVKAEYLQAAIEELNLPVLQQPIIQGEWSIDILY